MPPDPRGHRDAYLQTVYHALDAAFTLSPTPAGPAPFAGRTFSLITAANPRSEVLPEAENLRRNAGLEAELRRRGVEHGPSFGMDPARSWREDGFVLWDAPAAVALELGRAWEQNAVVHGGDGRVALAWCDDGELEWFWPAPADPRADRPPE